MPYLLLGLKLCALFVVRTKTLLGLKLCDLFVVGTKTVCLICCWD